MTNEDVRGMVERLLTIEKERDDLRAGLAEYFGFSAAPVTSGRLDVKPAGYFDKFNKTTKRARGEACGECGSVSSRHKKTCSQAGGNKFSEAQLLPTKKNKEAAGGKQGKRGMSDEQRNEIINLNRGGKTDPEITAETGASKSTIYRVLQAAGLKSNKLKKASKKERAGTYGFDDSPRGSAMPINKFQQVKIAVSHQVPEETIAKEMHLTEAEVKRAVLARTYESYLVT